MLEHPVDPPVLAVKLTAVTIREVRAISRKDCICQVQNPQRPYARPGWPSQDDMARTAWRHAERDRNERAPVTRWAVTE